MKEKIGVVGAGLMGAEIGLVFALAGHEVLLSDQSEAALSGALERLDRVLDRGISRGFYKDEEKPAALARLRKIGRAQSELQSHVNLVCRLLLEKKKKKKIKI